MSHSAAVPELDAVVDYDAVYADYLASLIDTLRGFSAKVPGLELWVPDENLLVSLENLLDSATNLGRASVVLQLSTGTLKHVNEAALLELAGRFGAAQLERCGSAFHLSVVGLGQRQAALSTASREPRALPTGAIPAPATAASPALASASSGSASASRLAAPELPDIHLPALERCAVLSQPISSSDAAADPTRLSASHADCTLLLEVSSTHVIQSAWLQAQHPLDTRLLSELCRIVCGLPLLEACYHGAIRLEHRLRPAPSARALPGIVLPRAAHPRFALAETLLRAALEQYRALTGYRETSSHYDDRPARSWLDASSDERQARLESALAAALPSLGLAPGDVSVAGVRHDVRVELAFGEAWRRFDQPQLVRELEAALRERVDARLEVYVEELRDKNKLRRLAVVEDPR